MKSFKYILTISLAIPILALFSKGAFANAEVILTDNTETHIATVSITHGDETLNAADLEVVFSDNINILNLDPGNLDCSMSNSVTEEGNKVAILCLSETDLAKTGTVAEITYEVGDGGDYYFYVDQATIDLGDIVIDKVTDINKPVSVVEAENLPSGEDKDNTVFANIWIFIQAYYVYIISGVFILALVIVLLTSIKKDGSSTPTSTPTPTVV